jgi:integrase
MELIIVVKNLVEKVKKSENIMTFEEVSREWLKSKKSFIKQSTYYNYVYKLEKYLIPKFKDKKMKYFKKYNFEELIENLSQELSNKTVKDIVNILKSIFKFAKKEYNHKIDYEEAVIPKIKTKEVTIFSSKERKRLESYCKKSGTLKDIGILVCLYTGIRIGEICALKWKNIDLERRTIYIEQTMQRVIKKGERSKVIIDSPKSYKSNRTIPIADKLYQVLKPLELKNRGEKNGENFFLTGSKDKYIEPRNYQYAFKKILKNSRIRKYKFHILRHTFASSCIEVGMDIKALSEILGHSSVDISLNVYVHSSYKKKKKYLEKL